MYLALEVQGRRRYIALKKKRYALRMRRASRQHRPQRLERLLVEISSLKVDA